MAAHATSSNRLDTRRLNPAVARLLNVLTRTTLAMLSLLALWLLTRRMGGQLQRPLSLPGLMVVAVTLVGLAAWLRVVWYHTMPPIIHWKSRSALAWFMPSAVMLVLAIALSIGGTGTVHLLVFWGILLATEGIWWSIAWRQMYAAATGPNGETGPSMANSQHNATAPPPPSSEDHQPNLANPTALKTVEATLSLPSNSIAQVPNALLQNDEADAVMPMDESDDHDPLSDDISQQITRTHAQREDDTVTGLLRACFSPNERSRSLHVAFCPSMLRCPKVTVLQMSGPRARIKAADVQTFGIRFDVRLAGTCAEEQDVLLHFEASCTKPESVGLGEIDT